MEKTKKIIASILLMTFVFTFVALPIASAHDPPFNISTYSYLSVAPDLVGVGQTVYVMFWLNRPPPTALGAYGDRWEGITIEVTKPDGNTESLGPFRSDPVGGAVTQYTPSQAGTYSFKGIFPGQTLAGDNLDPLENRGGDVYIGDYFEPSTSSVSSLIVQQEQIAQPPDYPLPTDYWTRPIEGQNTNWYTLASNWLGKPKIALRFQPDGAAPNTSHIQWVKEYEFGGVVGGTDTSSLGMTYYTGLNYEAKFQTPIIMNGRLYYELPLSNNALGGIYVCVDLATGEELWRQDITGISIGQLYDYESPNQHGVIPNGYLWKAPGRSDPPGTPWEAYDPFTGELVFSMNNVPSGTQAYGPKGELLIYQLNYAGRWLACWNNTASPDLLGTLTSSGAWQWRPVGKTVDGSKGYSWNVTIPDLPGLSNPSIVYVIPNDLLLGCSSTFVTNAAYGGTPDPYTFWAISLKPGAIGKLLWIKDYPAPENDITRTVYADPGWPLVDPESRVFLMRDVETMQNWGYSIDTGERLWGPTDPEESAWDFFFSTGGQLSCKTIAYGNLYSGGYSGILYCYDLQTGQLEWKYNSTYAGFATPYGRYTTGIGAVADGKVYLFSSEHSPTSPYWKGAKIRCVDAYTGEELWSMFGYSGVGSNNGMAIADGYLVYLNLYDMQLYCIGKGPSQTTVDAPLTAVQLGSSVTIRGRVTDISAGTNQEETAKRFPNGVPAISDEDQSAWMEYVYMQKPIPEDAKGVTVKLYSIDPNGNYQDIGEATSDMWGNFGKSWVPPVEGEYLIIAEFSGTSSYYKSSASTYITVDPSQSAGGSIEPEPIEAPLITTELAIILAAIIVAVAVISGFLVLRKRK
jgi:outer membrane protein assembly factor BamB